jgi:hypothetical protein
LYISKQQQWTASAVSDRKISVVDLSGYGEEWWPKPDIAAWATGQLVLVSVGGMPDPGHLFLFSSSFLGFAFFSPASHVEGWSISGKSWMGQSESCPPLGRRGHRTEVEVFQWGGQGESDPG